MSMGCYFIHFVTSVQIQTSFWSIFSPTTRKYGPEKTPYLDIFTNWFCILHKIKKSHYVIDNKAFTQWKINSLFQACNAYIYFKKIVKAQNIVVFFLVISLLKDVPNASLILELFQSFFKKWSDSILK